MNFSKDLKRGLRAGLPIGLGYVPVSLAFGFFAVSGGVPVGIAVLISLTNLTSAGQFAGTNLIIAGAGYIEIALTTFIINLRYMLMSLSLSQRVDEKTTVFQRMLFAFGITDETFVVASMESKTLTAGYMTGLIILPIAGWNLGTLAGACVSNVFPQALQNAMGIALYAMFIALIIPAARESIKILAVILIAVAVMCMLKYIQVFSFISSGFRVIIATVAAAAAGAALFPSDSEAADHE